MKKTIYDNLYKSIDCYWKIKKVKSGLYTLNTRWLKRKYDITIYFDNYTKLWYCEICYNGKYIQRINDCKTKKQVIDELEEILNNEHIRLDPFVDYLNTSKH